jgi:hypothetical protein
VTEPPPLRGAAPPPAPDAGRRALGTLLLAIGGLIAGLCGLCTLGVCGKLLVEISQAGSAEDARTGTNVMLFILVVGGFSTGVGLIVGFAGMMMRRKPR